jgi:hypothetical protein
MLYLTRRIYNYIVTRVRLETRGGTRRDVNTYNKTYILLYLLVKLLRRSKGKNKRNIRRITLKNSSSIVIGVIELTILLINIVEVENVLRVLYIPKLNLRSRP